MKRVRNEYHNRNTYYYQSIRAIERKLYLVELRGGACEICGYNKNLSALDFHHKNKAEKENILDSRHLANTKIEVILMEFEKCIVLCANCHREEHNPNSDMLKIKDRAVEFKNSLVIIRKNIGYPNCVDCNKKISYNYKRCRPCSALQRRKEGRPEKDVLRGEFSLNGTVWCSKKYNVVPQTIRKWLK